MAKDLSKAMTQAEFGRLIGLTRQRIGQLVKEGLPLNVSGRVKVDAAIAWIRENVETSAPLLSTLVSGGTPEVAASDDVADPSNVAEARRQKLIEETKLIRLVTREKDRSLVNKADTEVALKNFSRLIRDKWLNFPNRYGGQIAAEVGCEPKLLMATLERFVREQLFDIADAKPALPK